ncbi:MAG: hypothetical protein ABJA02_07665 [Acidobacteriota bacterium]
MAEVQDLSLPSQTAFCSSVADDVWHDQKAQKAYEWWHFDALSDDGTEAVAITFTDNNVFSTQYAHPFVTKEPIPSARQSSSDRSPAVSFLYWADGRTSVKSVDQYSASDFEASRERPECRIGENSFRTHSAEYGIGYVVEIDLPLMNGGRVAASFEWLSVDADLTSSSGTAGHSLGWNLVAARSDVSGRIDVFGADGRSTKTAHFRGTGYHDHIRGTEAIYEDVTFRQWGRAHFVDITAVYCIRKGRDNEPLDAKLVLTQDREITVYPVEFHPRQNHRDKFGIKYPMQIDLDTGGGAHLGVTVIKPIDSTFYNVRFLSEMKLETSDGKTRTAAALTAILSPANMRYRLVRWFAERQSSKNDFRSSV